MNSDKNIYTQADLDLFRRLLDSFKDGSVDSQTALHFQSLGWIRQISFNPLAWEVTDIGLLKLS